MKPTPKGWPRISSSVFYADAAKAIDWLCEAFGFEVRLKVTGEDGSIVHSELTYGDDGVIMVSQSGKKKPEMPLYPSGASPKALAGGVNTQMLMLIVDDADSHFARAVAAGAVVIDPPRIHDYGEEYWADRSYGVLDLEGHVWWVTQRVRDPKS